MDLNVGDIVTIKGRSIRRRVTAVGETMFLSVDHDHSAPNPTEHALPISRVTDVTAAARRNPGYERVPLDKAPGNANTAYARQFMVQNKAKHPVRTGEAVCFSYAMCAPTVVEWLVERGRLDANWEQREGEGVTVTVGDWRIYVGDWVVLSEDRITFRVIRD